MSLKLRNTKEFVDPDKFRMVALIYSLPGSGKTSLVGTCPPEDTIIAACETGNGSGLLPIADKGFDCVEPSDMVELEKFCRGEVFPNKKFLVLDSISAMYKTFIKEAGLKFPRQGSDTEKRKAGIADLADYGVLAELTRRLLNILMSCNPDKHILVTALEKYDRPNENDAPGTESLIGPDLPGQLFLGVPAFFDFVFRLRTRPKLKNPADPKSRYYERYLQTQQSQGVIAKSRAVSKGVSLLDAEEIVDLDSGKGTIPYLINKIKTGYTNASDHQREESPVLLKA